MSLESSSAELLAAGGLFAERWPGFIARVSQQAMADLVEQGMAERRSLVIEAPSGSGKTLAYLVPVVNRRKRAVISTASRYLQQQLYRQDIPLVKKILNVSCSVALLQGRRHYLCPYYLETNLQDRPELGKKTLAQLSQLLQRYRTSGIGELSVLAPELPASLRPLVSSGADNCLGNHCPKRSQCPLMIAREKAQQADIVVVNHSLLFADQRLQREQLGQLLPASDIVVVDEAHRLGDFAQPLLGSQMSSTSLHAFMRDLLLGIADAAPEQRRLKASLLQLQRGLQSLVDHLPDNGSHQPQQYTAIVQQLVVAFERLQQQLQHLQQRSQRLAELSVRNQQIVLRLQSIAGTDCLCWIQKTLSGFILQSIPGKVSPLIAELSAQTTGSWLFTSATLSAADHAQGFLTELGLDKSLYHQLGGDIDYQQQAKLFTPRIPVLPGQSDYTRYLLAEVIPLLKMVAGRVLFLFSSYRALTRAAEQLALLGDYQLFVQRADQQRIESDHYRLITAFKQSPRGVLLGTGSFWEGVDLSGAELKAVIIDKLPFALPTDPLVELRTAELNRLGVDSFSQYLLPEAVIRLRQGCGRLLRRISDRGVIMLADPRLHSKDYGDLFISSLPAMEQVFSLEALSTFLQPNDSDRLENSEIE